MDKIKTFLETNYGKIILLVIVFVLGGLVGYILLPTKIHEVSTQIATQAHINTTSHQVTVTANGQTTTTIDTHSTTDAQSQLNQHILDIINPKSFILTLDGGMGFPDNDIILGITGLYKPSWWVLGASFERSIKTNNNLIIAHIGFGI